MRLGLLQSNFVLVIGIILLIPFSNFSDTSVYISSRPSWYYKSIRVGWYYVGLLLVDEIDDSPCGLGAELCGGDVFAHVKLDVALLEVVVVHLYVPGDGAATQVDDPRRHPLATPEALEVQVVAGNLHAEFASIA